MYASLYVMWDKINTFLKYVLLHTTVKITVSSVTYGVLKNSNVHPDEKQLVYKERRLPLCFRVHGAYTPRKDYTPRIQRNRKTCM